MLALFLTLTIATSAAAAETYAGRRLVDALRDLEAKGLRLVYSESTVPPHLVVKSEPGATTPRGILDEILAPHDLRADPGPRGTLLIVRSEAKKQSRAEMPIALAEIVVTPSQFEILRSQPATRQFMSREEVRSVPHLSDDLFRAISRIPGTTSSDVTARPNIRGGAEDEVAVIIDGAEVYDPFHLKDLFRAFSTIDAEAVGAVDIFTGGFPAEYGGRMSGVINVDSLTPAETTTEIGVSLLNARFISHGRFRAGRGEWLLSFRRGYLREMLQLVDDNDQLDPRYYDLLGKVQWTLPGSGLISAHVLASRDRVEINEPDENANATYGDTYFWLNARGAPVPRLYLQSVLSTAGLKTGRHGAYGGEFFNESGRVDEDKNARIIALKNDLSFDVSGSNVLKAGATLRRVRAHYRYDASSLIRFAPAVAGGPPGQFARAADVSVSGSEFSAYVADRIRLGERVVVEAGLRAEGESYTPDGVNVSPRVNVAWLAGPRTSVRAAWGRFSQSQSIFELPVQDGQTDFSPAQHAVHRVIGIDQTLSLRFGARIEVYDKRFSDLRVRYENIFDSLILFPELRGDRVRVTPEGGRARGAEILLRLERGEEPLSGWVSYTWSEVTDRIAGRDVPRSWDQRNAATFSVNYRRGALWNFNVAGTYHGGWPTTPVSASVVEGRVVAQAEARNSDRLPSYRRVDFRASRNVPAGRGAVSFFVELFNVLSQSNVVRVSGFTFTSTGQDVVVSPNYDALFGVIPSFGVTWRF